jgi:hypothetical protein
MHVRLCSCLLALLPTYLTQCLIFFWLTCIVSTHGVQPQPPCHRPQLHNISVDKDNMEVDYYEHDWHLVPELTCELSGQSVLCGTNGNMHVVVYEVHSPLFKGKIGQFAVIVSHICLEVQ